MSGFVEVPASKHSLTMRKLIFGFGINDADYVVCQTVNGSQVMCPYYRAWRNMIERCYSPKSLEKYPTYKGCSVTDEWRIFSTFKAWMVKQAWEGNCLDKDILIQGNKVYGPENCLFVTQAINLLLTDCGASRGEWPVGVCFDKVKGKFKAQCAVEGKNKYLGYFNTPEETHEAYKLFKYEVIAETAIQQTEPLRSALLNYRIEQDEVIN